MRRFRAIPIALQCARLAIAGALPLTGKDIAVMLRMGYSSEDIMHDLSAKHFAGPLDSSSEAQIRQLNCSPKLLDGLKSGQFDATTDQLTQAQQKITAVNAAAEKSIEQQRIALHADEAVKSPSTEGTAAQNGTSSAKRDQERPHAPPKIIDLQIGKILDLRDFDGPNMRLIVNAVEMDDVIITLLDYDHMVVVGGGDGSGYLTRILSEPTTTHKRVTKEDNSLLYKWGQSKLVYIDAMDTALNHVKVGIVSE
jgi:hypothetical protein